MNNRTLVLLTAIVLICFTASCHLFSKPSLEEQMLRLEAFLNTAEIVAVDRELESGRTGGWDVILEKDGQRRKARFKHVHKHRPVFLADSYQYELAAYSLSKMLSLTIIPPMVPKQIDGVSGSLQIFMENCINENDFISREQNPPAPDQYKRAKAVVQIFELLVADECNDAQDTLILPETFKICRIDFSEAFKPDPALSSGCAVSSCSRTLYEALKKLKKEELAEKLGVYLNEEEREGLWLRAGQIISQLNILIKNLGEEKVLFDF